MRRDHEVNRRGSKEYEEAIQQKEEEFLRIEGWRQYMAGKQKKSIWTDSQRSWIKKDMDSLESWKTLV